MTSNVINVGDTLKVSEEEEKVPEDYLIYTVKSGDSLWKIANKYNTTVDTLMDINNLTSTNLTINQQLLIPSEQEIEVEITETEGIPYIVKSGDSLWKIATTYNTTVDAIKKANNLTNNNLSIGQKLIIPVKQTTAEEVEEETTGGIKYIVSSGDNLYSIANKYNTTVDAIKKANNLTSNLLTIGQELIIPGTENFATYVVQKGDSLWKIANQYGITVNDLMKANNLESSNLSIGQELIIPSN